MKKFILQTIIFCILSCFGWMGMCFFADGETDPFYLRFTTDKKSNLILGCSRAAQGIKPSVLRDSLGLEVFNYAFTVSHSPYGPVYLKSILNKLNTTSNKGIFILAVSPWTISSITEEPNDSSNFRENKLCLNSTNFVNSWPNFQYLYNNLSGKYTDMIFKSNSPCFLHDDGWLETRIKNDSISIKERRERKEIIYKNSMLPKYKFSSLRLQYLKKTISKLNKHGSVYLVRLPMHEAILKIEESLKFNFNKKIESLTPKTKGFLDLTSKCQSYKYTDGNHLQNESAEKVSKHIANWILSLEKDNF